MMGKVGVVVVAMLGLALAAAAPAQAQTAAGACEDRKLRGAQCGTFPVPLDHGTPGGAQLQLAYVRYPAAAERRGTIVFLAGGPGQAATPIAASAARGPLAAVGRRYDLVFIDQRGTGESAPLRCSTAPNGVFRVKSASASAVAAAAATCAEELGERRRFFTTYESALDLEDLRVHLGVEQIIPLGVSYGGQLAGEYARRFPERTQAVILDSTSPIEGGDMLAELPSLALPRVLRETCFPPGCARLFAAPEALMAAAVERLGEDGLTGRYVTAEGRRRSGTVDVGDLYELVRISDTDPALRTALPAAMEAAARGDAAPLLRIATSGIRGGDDDEDEDEAVNEVRMLATDCVEGRLPWAPDSDPATRPALLAEAMRAKAERYAPFPVEEITPKLEAAMCVGWPATPSPPRPASGGPDVPVLILGGRDDLRTPLEDQRRAGLQYPNATVVAVPNTGHSVLSTDETGCARDALASFLFGRKRAACPNRPPVPLAMPAYTDLDDLPATTGDRIPRRVSRTVVAVDLTLRDVIRQILAVTAGSAASSGDTEDRAIRLGGLRGGRMELRRQTVTLRAYEVVPGVRVSGRLDDDFEGTVVVSGTGAAGTLRVTEDDLRGTLGGETIRYTPLAVPGA